VTAESEVSVPLSTVRVVRTPVVPGMRMRYHETFWHNRYVVAQGTWHSVCKCEHPLGDTTFSPCWAVENTPGTWGGFHRSSGYYVTSDKGNTLEQPAWFTSAFKDKR
jgi:hypothetical protein